MLGLAAEDLWQQRAELRRTSVSASVYIFLSYVAIAMTYAPLSQLLLVHACAEHGIGEAHCRETVDGVATPGYDAAQKQAALLLSVYAACTGIAQLATCALLGSAGDAWGRRLPLTLPLANGALGGVAACAFLGGGEVIVFLVVSFFASLLGGQFVSNHAAFAALADATRGATPEDRSAVFGAAEGAMWAGLLVGPVLGGHAAELLGNGLRASFALSAAVHVCNLLLTVATFHETLDRARRKPLRWRSASPFHSLAMFLETRNTVLFGIMTLAGLTASSGGASVLTLYAAKWAGLSPKDLGWLLTVNFGACCVGLTLVFPVLLWHASLRKILILSSLNTFLSWLIMAMCRERWQIFLVAGSQLLSSVFLPIVRMGMVHHFGERRHGECLAAVGCAEQLAVAAGAPLLGMAYRATEDVFFPIGGGGAVSGVAFLLLAALGLASLAAALLVQGLQALPPRCAHESAGCPDPPCAAAGGG